jgi:hypothetical protein
MQDLERYRRWLRARGIQDPTDDEVKMFQEKAKSDLRGSLVEFLVYMRMDAGMPQSGTRRWLGLQGVVDPSPEDLSYFRRKLRTTFAWRGSLVLALVVGWFIFLRFTGLRLSGLNIVPPISGFEYGITNAFGTKLPGPQR